MQITQKKFGFTVIEVTIVIGIIFLAAGAYFLSKNKSSADVVVKSPAVKSAPYEPQFYTKNQHGFFDQKVPKTGFAFTVNLVVNLQSSGLSEFVKYSSGATNPSLTYGNACNGSTTYFASCNINLTSSTTLKAISYNNGTTTSNLSTNPGSKLATASFTKVSPLAPLFTPIPAITSNKVKVGSSIKLTARTNPSDDGLMHNYQYSIRYSTDGSYPGINCPMISPKECSVKLNTKGTVTLKALTDITGTISNSVGSKTYIVQ